MKLFDEHSRINKNEEIIQRPLNPYYSKINKYKII